MRRLLPCLALLLASCGSASPDDGRAQAGEPCGRELACAEGLTCAVDGERADATGVCVRGAAPERTAAWFAERIDVRMTEADVRAAFGPPARDIGDEVHIYVYELEDGTEVWIGLAERVLYARNVDKEGNLVEVLLDGEVVPAMEGEPVTFEPPAGMRVTKIVQPLPGGPVADPSICGGAKEVDLGGGEVTLYLLQDQEGAAAYAVSVVPNGPGFQDAAEVAAAFGCDDLPLLAVSERRLVFGIRPASTPSALAAEEAVRSTLVPR